MLCYRIWLHHTNIWLAYSILQSLTGASRASPLRSGAPCGRHRTGSWCHAGPLCDQYIYIYIYIYIHTHIHTYIHIYIYGCLPLIGRSFIGVDLLETSIVTNCWSFIGMILLSKCLYWYEFAQTIINNAPTNKEVKNPISNGLGHACSCSCTQCWICFVFLTDGLLLLLCTNLWAPAAGLTGPLRTMVCVCSDSAPVRECVRSRVRTRARAKSYHGPRQRNARFSRGDLTTLSQTIISGSTRMSPEFQQNFTGMAPEFTRNHRNVTRISPETHRNFTRISNGSSLKKVTSN